MAQLGVPDMQTPISAALRWPKRTKTSVPPLDLAQYGNLTFEPPDRDRFPCLSLAEAAMRQGGAAPIAMNAANEVAVRAFLDGTCRFGGIAQIVENVLEQTRAEPPESLDEIAIIDADSRTKAHASVAKFSK